MTLDVIPVQDKFYCGVMYSACVPEAKVMDMQAKVCSAISDVPVIGHTCTQKKEAKRSY